MKLESSVFRFYIARFTFLILCVWKPWMIAKTRFPRNSKEILGILGKTCLSRPPAERREMPPGNPLYKFLRVLVPAPTKKYDLDPIPHFFEVWQAGFRFPRILGIPRKSLEFPRTGKLGNRAPDTNRRCGRLRMVRVVISEPMVAARRRVGVAGQGNLNFQGFPWSPWKMANPQNSDLDEEKYFPRMFTRFLVWSPNIKM